jgi:hypothetical protein
MECGNSENHPVILGVSRHSTVGVLPKIFPDLSIHRENGLRANPKRRKSWGAGSLAE